VCFGETTMVVDPQIPWERGRGLLEGPGMVHVESRVFLI
jgi:hypothetical protein